MPFALRVTAPEEWGAVAAEALDAALRVRPDAVAGWPTGATPQPLYAELRRRAGGEASRYAGMRAVMLDDYFDSASLGTNSYRWLQREFLGPLGVALPRLLRIPIAAEGIAEACRQFEEDLHAWGGCDLQFLGLGANGHIGFNEPGATADSRTRVVELTEETARANAGYWPGGYTPQRAVTMGIGTILAARTICLLVRGSAKAEILRSALCGPIGAAVPASYLRRSSGLQVIADGAAAALLPKEWRTAGESVVCC